MRFPTTVEIQLPEKHVSHFPPLCVLNPAILHRATPLVLLILKSGAARRRAVPPRKRAKSKSKPITIVFFCKEYNHIEDDISKILLQVECEL
uniref:Uncharacterized protein n=1 Tax=Romanomermis culicivorax TaxID=13658 RepID=A0A915JJU7_ROMCU